jgi:D-aminopeptidase
MWRATKAIVHARWSLNELIDAAQATGQRVGEDHALNSATANERQAPVGGARGDDCAPRGTSRRAQSACGALAAMRRAWSEASGQLSCPPASEARAGTDRMVRRDPVRRQNPGLALVGA